MTKLKAIAIDDEPLALKLVKDYITKTGFLELVGTFDNPIDTFEYLNENVVDLVFLDIQMPDLNGIEFIKSLIKPPKIIFTTAYEKYALEGFKLSAIDYLLKPFSYQEFLLASQKALKVTELERNNGNKAIEAIEKEFLFLRSEYKIRKINFKNILYIEGLKDYIKVYLDSEPKPILSLNTIKSLVAKLPEQQFMRIHRSFIVNLNKVETIERSRIVINGAYIPISDQYKDKFQEYLDNNFL